MSQLLTLEAPERRVWQQVPEAFPFYVKVWLPASSACSHWRCSPGAGAKGAIWALQIGAVPKQSQITLLWDLLRRAGFPAKRRGAANGATGEGRAGRRRFPVKH